MGRQLSVLNRISAIPALGNFFNRDFNRLFANIGRASKIRLIVISDLAALSMGLQVTERDELTLRGQ